MEPTYHYPPELLQLLVDTIPRLVKSKSDVLALFRGAGVSPALFTDVAAQLKQDRQSVSTFHIARTILTRLNERGDECIRERREVLKRVTEWEDFSTCWENNRLEAQGLVARVRAVVDVKDSFTRMKLERDREHEVHRTEAQRRANAAALRAAEKARVKEALYALFAERDAHKRGRALEPCLNDLFKMHDILVREAFTLRKAGNGIIEQIDGSIQLDGHIYVVEMKWWNEPLGPGDVAQHLVRVYQREGARALFISYTEFTAATVDVCREALQQRVVVLTRLAEVVSWLAHDFDLSTLLRTKVNAAINDRKPWLDLTVQ